MIGIERQDQVYAAGRKVCAVFAPLDERDVAQPRFLSRRCPGLREEIVEDVFGQNLAFGSHGRAQVSGSM